VDATRTLDRVPPEAVASPRVLERYRLARRLGAGAYGAVWLAYDETLERDVAVKVVAREPVNADSPRGRTRTRAEHEALAVARLNHPGIVTLYEAGADEEAHYLVSELVDGATLAQAIAGRALSDRDVLRIGVALCDALAHAHARGVIHRDIKPGNVVIPKRPQSEAGVAKLTDFGVAQLAGADALTHTGDVVGTLAYMAPEQAEGRRVEPRSDLYAMALVLYEALVGFNPVRGAAPAATARRLAAGIPPLHRLRRDLPHELAAALDRALDTRPDNRGDVADLRAALEDALPEVSDEGRRLAPRLPPWPRSDSRGRRVAGRVASALAAGGMAASGIALTSSPPAAPTVIGLAVAAAAVVLPRVTWLTAAVAAVVWLAAGSPQDPGAALLVAAGLVACPLLMPRAGRWWSVPAAAPLLAVAGVAACFPALAGQARRWWVRGALGAAGYWWLALAEAIAGRDWHFGRAAGTQAPNAWLDSAAEAARHALVPTVGSGVLAVAVLWALAAAVLPWVLHSRSLAVDVLGAGAWIAGLVAGSEALGEALKGTVAQPHPRGALAGAALGGVLALAARRVRGGTADAPVA
jgi:hypothetical protein